MSSPPGYQLSLAFARNASGSLSPVKYSVAVPARQAQTGVPNPFKPGELMDRPAKPACYKIKVRALKTLKDALQ